ncbi:hypothetical protein [Erythrobacter sp. EC-HK427]|uniref:hypothetical protein n=1 Tax=Erythrobacter sp. EC-HK427 TaxID=2038396 RepID=UPI00125216DF|nr:hypothetical protein [Erythrobacter sp. EC-HK427]VVT07525.1 conserved hypothetical protein [Erythrobacter sp. EC-HK427]
MVRHRLDSVNDFARQGYLLRITCNVCSHSVDADPIGMLDQLHRLGLGYGIADLEGRMKCRRCKWRGATITATDPAI